jgi:hypothetical protein
MHAQWPHLRKAIEGAIHAVEKTERGSFRVHTSSAEREAVEIGKHSKGDERDHAKTVEAAVHKAKGQIDITKSVPFLQQALEVVKTYAKDGPPPAP